MTENTETTIANESTNAAEIAPVAPARPTPSIRVNRRVYVDHKLHGTCITLSAVVYVAPKANMFPAKSAPKVDFIVENGQDGVRVFDTDGNEWLAAGENPGCGPRCPVSMRETFGKAWVTLSHEQRRQLIKATMAPAAPPAEPKAE